MSVSISSPGKGAEPGAPSQTALARLRSRRGSGGLPRRFPSRALAVAAAALALAACAATQQADAVAPQAAGFWLGVWHGFIFPIAWIVSLFVDKVAIYAVPNNGGWYDFGYFLGVVVLGVGARKGQVRVRRR